ncbi:hypothetical protein [Pseudoalteromonas nigrifaciens]|uniref:hypothetical protein n=1 Tax=Pseudoalteromonas nigrifaciens TaxID=28109 RepID=UPI003FD0BB13
MVRSLRKQVGAVIPNYVAILLMVAMGAWFALENMQTAVIQQQNELVQSMKGQVMHRINAMQSCYNDQRDWCAPGDLADYGLSNEAINNSFIVDQLQSGDNVKVTVQAPSVQMAQAFSKHVIDPEVNGPQVTFIVEPPTKSDILKNQIQRYADTEFNRNSLETNIEMGNRNVENINLAKGTTGEFQSLKADRQETRNLKVNRKLTIGNNEIQFDTNDVTFNANDIVISNQASIDGDISLNNNNIAGIANVDTRNVTATDLSARNATVNSLEGERINYNTANINSLEAYKYTSQQYTSDQLEVTTLNSNSLVGDIDSSNGNINDLSFSSAKGGNWNYDSSQTNRVVSNTSSLGGASGQNLVVANDLRGQSMRSVTGQFTSINILGLTTGSQFNSAGDFVSSNSSVNNNHVSLVSQRDLISNNANSIQSTTNEIASTGSDIATNTNDITQNKNESENNKSSIATNTSNITANTNDIDDVADSLDSSADKLDLWQDRLDKCMYQTQYCIPQDPTISLTCRGCSQYSARSSFYSKATATISSCRQGCSYSWVVSNTFTKSSGSCASGTIPKGGSATPTCSIHKLGISAQEIVAGSIRINVNNKHYTDRDREGYVQVRYKNTSVPKPVVSTSCSGCNYKGTSNSNSALITSSISNCPQGCSYTWNMSGGATGSCPSGNVSAGSSASPSCSIYGTVANASSKSGSVGLTVKNKVDTSYSDMDYEAYTWENTTPNDPIADAAAGCYVDTWREDVTSSGACVGTVMGDTTVAFSAGDTRRYNSFVFKDMGDWQVSWSGDCVSNSTYCSIRNVYSMPGDTMFTSTATIKHIPSGKTKQVTVHAQVTKEQ